MSGIGGAFARRGGPIDAKAIASLSRSLRDGNSGGELHATDADVVLVQCDGHIDVSSGLPDEQVKTVQGDIVVYDGRIDNLDEVARRLELDRDSGRNSRVAIATAYRRYGVRGLAMFVGDFGMALWDPADQKLILAADPIGRKSIYYICTEQYIYWSTRARPLLVMAGIAPEYDEDYLADFLSSRTPARGPFKGIDVVLGSHAVVVDRSRYHRLRYWSPDPSRVIRYRSDAEYEEHFRTIFDEAVACRLQTRGPAFCELSGGVDSSTIACVADRLIKHSVAAAPALHTVTYTFPQSRSADETAYVTEVENQIGRCGFRISDDEHPLLAPLPRGLECDIPTTSLWVIARYEKLSQLMRSVGAKIVLSGMGGDQMFWSQYPPGLPATDLVAMGKIRGALAYCSAISRLQHRSVLDTIWHGGCEPFLPRALRARMQGAREVGPWFTGAFVRRYQLHDRMLPDRDDVGFPSPTTRLQYGYIRRTMRPFALERCASDGMIEFRYPYLDQRLIEFSLAIPLEQKIRLNESRSLVRRSLRGTVPQTVIDRETKAGPSEAFHRALRREWPRLADLLTEPRLADLGIVDRTRFATALERARHGAAPQQAQLSWTIALELWIRHIEDPHFRGDRAARPAA